MVAATPVLSATQRAWLQEIGIDARMLVHFSAEPFGASEPDVATQVPSGSEAEVATQAPSGERRKGAPVPVAELLKRAPVTPVADPGPPAIAPVPGAALPTDATLAALAAHAAGCTACGLHEVRSRTVFGAGLDQTPRWMFIGEAPGEYDESAGQPFQGRAGELLQAMLASVGLGDAAPVYFTNVLKCRPIGNRSPEAAEIAACLPMLRRQISLLRPGCLVALGRVSAGALLGHDADLDTLRGSVHEYIDDEGRRIPVVVTHHPASLLLHAQHKADAWRDLNLLKGLGAEVPLSAA